MSKVSLRVKPCFSATILKISEAKSNAGDVGDVGEAVVVGVLGVVGVFGVVGVLGVVDAFLAAVSGGDISERACFMLSGGF
jgi:hypothetical protein